MLCGWSMFVIYLFCNYAGCSCSSQRLQQNSHEWCKLWQLQLQRERGAAPPSFSRHCNLTLSPSPALQPWFLPWCLGAAQGRSCKWQCSTAPTKCPVIPIQGWKRWHSAERYQRPPDNRLSLLLLQEAGGGERHGDWGATLREVVGSRACFLAELRRFKDPSTHLLNSQGQHHHPLL